MCNVSVPLLAHFFQFASLSSFNHSELGRWRWRNQRGANSWTIYAQTSEWIREEPGVGSLPLIIWKPENERARREANTWVGLQRPTWEYLFIIMTIRSAAHFKRKWADYSTVCNATQSPQHFSFLQTKDFMPKFLQSSQITTCVIINLRNKSHSSIVRTEEQDRKVDTQTYFEKPPYLSVGFWQN